MLEKLQMKNSKRKFETKSSEQLKQTKKEKR